MCMVHSSIVDATSAVAVAVFSSIVDGAILAMAVAVRSDSHVDLCYALSQLAQGRETADRGVR